MAGRVQGLGFRPFVYRVATELGIRGTVSNSARGVEVICQGARVRPFIERLRTGPPLAAVSGLTVEPIRRRPFADFRIVGSGGRGPGQDLEVLPDLATCHDCRNDFSDADDRRAGYAFTNCTQCGPRYSIILGLPYDRPLTTMKRFRMCPDCGREYQDPADRRFHAQPNACPACGPKLTLLDRRGRTLAGDPMDRAARALAAGKIVAIKSIGGFQLACDARNEAAVAKLRRRKDRPFKPLALMCADLRSVRRFARVSQAEADLLLSPAAPIVLLERTAGAGQLGLVAPGSPRLGVMLAYTPLHHLLFGRLDPGTALVMTSGNRRDEPIATAAGEVLAGLPGVADLVLDHDRPIANRCDDSVVLPAPTSRTAPVVVRRSRGYAPMPVRLEPMFHVKRPVLALGGELQVYFALAEAGRCFASPYIGRLESPEAERFLLDTLDRYRRWTGIVPKAVACDLHPDYATTRLAERLAGRLPLVRVQHHYAHAVAAAAELGLAGPVLALAFDGTGYGTDGAVWGSEFILLQPGLSWQRVGHLAYRQLTETGVAIADPGRVAAAYLLQAIGNVPRGLGLSKQTDAARSVIRQGRSVLCSSMGRLFDAVAGITGVCRRATYEGEPAIALEAAAQEAGAMKPQIDTDGRGWAPDRAAKPQINTDRHRWAPIQNPKSKIQNPQSSLHPVLIDPDGFIREAAALTLSGVPAPVVAHRFHKSVGETVARAAARIGRAYRVRTVVLTGGVFQNSILRRMVAQRLDKQGFTVKWPSQLPVNDGGLVLGQAVVAGRLNE